jgi:HrpA-like RNA helicase
MHLPLVDALMEKGQDAPELMILPIYSQLPSDLQVGFFNIVG